jgi:hypothetical protein
MILILPINRLEYLAESELHLMHTHSSDTTEGKERHHSLKNKEKQRKLAY